MPLQIYVDDPPGAGFLAHSVLNEASSLNGYRQRWIGPGGFATVNNPNADTALSTSGAETCQIIIVHKRRGLGALGHYFALNKPHQIVRGVTQMIAGLGGQPVAAVVFAAGEIGVPATQQEYKLTIVGRVRALCPGASVDWPAAPSTGGHWGAAYYLPLAEEIALFESQPKGGGFEGMGDGPNGFTLHNY